MICSEPVAFAEVSIRPYVNGCQTSPVPFLEGIWVKSEYRKHGVGGELVRVISAWALGQGFIELGSDVEIGNQISMLAHEKWGFEETERVVYFRKGLKSSEHEPSGSIP